MRHLDKLIISKCMTLNNKNNTLVNFGGKTCGFILVPIPGFNFFVFNIIFACFEAPISNLNFFIFYCWVLAKFYDCFTDAVLHNLKNSEIYLVVGKSKCHTWSPGDILLLAVNLSVPSLWYMDYIYKLQCSWGKVP